MGHERIGFLPKRKQWNAIVQQLSEYQASSEATVKIADDTLTCLSEYIDNRPLIFIDYPC
ncbi:MAG: hypothetical protein AB1420_10895 [Bacillota bacterium]